MATWFKNLIRSNPKSTRVVQKPISVKTPPQASARDDHEFSRNSGDDSVPLVRGSGVGLSSLYATSPDASVTAKRFQRLIRSADNMSLLLNREYDFVEVSGRCASSTLTETLYLPSSTDAIDVRPNRLQPCYGVEIELDTSAGEYDGTLVNFDVQGYEFALEDHLTDMILAADAAPQAPMPLANRGLVPVSVSGRFRLSHAEERTFIYVIPAVRRNALGRTVPVPFLMYTPRALSASDAPATYLMDRNRIGVTVAMTNLGSSSSTNDADLRYAIRALIPGTEAWDRFI